MKKLQTLAVTATLAGMALVTPTEGATNWWGGDRWGGDRWWNDGPGYYRGGPWGYGGYGGPWGGYGGPWGGYGGPWGGYGGPWGYGGYPLVIQQPQAQSSTAKEPPAPKSPE
jgi:hypothetical protein